jgi:DNA-binding GntR family transcriptional regulator
MTQNQFIALCFKHCIEPRFALENEAIVEALKQRDDNAVEHILTTQF